MVDLTLLAGLPVKLDIDSFKLNFHSSVISSKPQDRLGSELIDVLYKPSQKIVDKEYYWMYRGVHRSADKNVFEKNGMRYDITVLRPGLISNEFVKTAGHYHPNIENGNLTYPEVYEVLYGVAHYILQKPTSLSNNTCEVADVILVEAHAGEKVVMLPGYGHITINPGDAPLVMANVVYGNFSSIYDPISQCKGGAYYETVNSNSIAEFIPNPHYSNFVPLRRLKAVSVPKLGIINGIPLYQLYIESPEKFKWLESPDIYANHFSSALVL